jgi:hypothetical protein
MALHPTHTRNDPQGAQPHHRKDTSMTTRPSNKATIDGVPRFIAYQCDHGGPIHFECDACGQHETGSKAYNYTADDGKSYHLCYGCVRCEAADPRFIWWAQASRQTPRRNRSATQPPSPSCATSSAESSSK